MSLAEHHQRTIPSLDGLRAIAVFAVILEHSQLPWLDRIPYNHLIRNGEQGVGMFFVISGFLITHLLLKEQNKTHTIDLPRFYLRRTFRIFPAFYAYILVISILGLLHLVQVHVTDVLAAATYTWNYAFFHGSWILGQCWSLSLEEQFYLLWPFAIVHLSRRGAIRASIAIILASPFLRVAMYFLVPGSREHLGMMLHTRLDTIMTGCLLALMLDSPFAEKVKHRLTHWSVPVASILFLLCIDAPAELRWRGMYTMTIGISLENVALVALLVFVVFRHQSLLGRLLNLPALRHVGMISYSLYLWQQLFTGPYTRAFPLGVVWALLCAETSFSLIERPARNLRDKVEMWMAARKLTASGRVAA